MPLVSSSPIESNPTFGSRTPRTTRAYAVPIAANCNRGCARHSTFAPESSSTAPHPAVGIVVASAGRSTPRRRPNARCAASIVAPVFPALKSATASPLATMPAATRTAARGLRRNAAAGDSCMPIVSGASTTVTSNLAASSCRRSSSRSNSRAPTRITPRSRCRAATSAPSTILRGAKSPPVASTAIRGRRTRI